MDTIDDYMQDARVTLNGKEVDINMILPTSTHARERSDLEDEAPTMYTNSVMFDCVSSLDRII